MKILTFPVSASFTRDYFIFPYSFFWVLQCGEQMCGRYIFKLSRN